VKIKTKRKNAAMRRYAIVESSCGKYFPDALVFSSFIDVFFSFFSV
jgi:hypothetical protein